MSSLVTIPEASKKYDISAYTLREWVKKDKVEFVNSGRKILIKESSLQSLMGINNDRSDVTDTSEDRVYSSEDVSAIADFIYKQAVGEADGEHSNLTDLINLVKSMRSMGISQAYARKCVDEVIKKL